MTVTTILDEILAHKQGEVAARRARCSQSELSARTRDMPPCRDFAAALQDAIGRNGAAVIAEIKRASPSAGLIRQDFDPAWLASRYQDGGAACLSVLTDAHYFQGDDEYLRQARAAVALPVLRKDFVVDEWQLFESRLLGADAILLIAAALSPAQLQEYSERAMALGLTVLLEVHDGEEMEVALATRAPLIGINNRDLRRFVTDLAVSETLAPRVDDGRLVVAESGIRDHGDVQRLQTAGIHAFLVGESLMRQPDPGVALRQLLGQS